MIIQMENDFVSDTNQANTTNIVTPDDYGTYTVEKSDVSRQKYRWCYGILYKNI